MLKLDRGLFVLVSALSLAACRGDEAETTASGSSTGASEGNSSTGAVIPTTSNGDSTTGDVGDSTTGAVTPTTSEPTTGCEMGFIDNCGTSTEATRCPTGRSAPRTTSACR
jgi:hypothetical protein